MGSRRGLAGTGFEMFGDKGGQGLNVCSLCLRAVKVCSELPGSSDTTGNWRIVTASERSLGCELAAAFQFISSLKRKACV